jgi:hypothetical protein
MSAVLATAKAADVQPAGAGVDRMHVDSAGSDGHEEDLYTRLKTLQRQLEFLEIQVSAGTPLEGVLLADHSCCVAASEHRSRDRAAHRRRSTSRRSRRT